MIEAITQAVSEVGPLVRAAIKEHAGFADIGKRMLVTWQEGVQGLRDKHIYALGDRSLGEAFTGFSEPPKQKGEKTVVGRSELLGKRK